MAQLPITNNKKDFLKSIGESIKEVPTEDQNFIVGMIYGTLYRKSKESKGQEDA